MGISHIISFINNVTKFIKSSLYFIAGKLRSFICQSQGHAKSNESQHETQADDLMTNSEDTDNYNDQTNEQIVQVTNMSRKLVVQTLLLVKQISFEIFMENKKLT